MLFLLFGSSGAGKTRVVTELRHRLPAIACHEFDEIEVPLNPNTEWRQRSNEVWIARALDYQAHGTDMVLAGQTPFGELLATPSAPRLNCIAACLLDCDDASRKQRLHERGAEWWNSSKAELADYLRWATWMRRHAIDPQWRPHVIRGPNAWCEMRWERWSDWRPGDRRWRVEVIDTSGSPVSAVATRLVEWIERERALYAAGRHPLAYWSSEASLS